MEEIQKLYKQYEKHIFRYLYGLTGSYHTAEELTQETFLGVVKSFYKFRGDSSVTTWLYSIARNIYLKWRRKESIIKIGLEEEHFNLAYENEPYHSVEEKERNTLLYKTLNELQEKEREIILLREWQELSYEEIAVIMGKSLPWVKVNIYRSRIKFKELYGKNYNKGVI